MTRSAESINLLCRERGLPQFQDLKSLRGFLSANEGDDKFQKALASHFAATCRAVSAESDLWFYQLRRVTDGIDSVDAVHCPVLQQALQRWSCVPEKLATPKSTARGERQADHENVHVYGSSAALCFELDTLRSEDDSGVLLHSLTIEAAKAIGRKRYDWITKTIFQLTRRELPLFIGTLAGAAPAWQASGHGVDHDKKLIVRVQESGVQLVVAQTGVQTLSVPVGADDFFSVLSLAMKALARNEPHLTPDLMLAMCRRAAAFFASSHQAQQKK